MPYATALLNGADNAATTLVASGGLAAGATSFVVASAAGFPAVPFAVGLGVYTTNYEEVIVTAVAGTTWTLLTATTKAHPNGEPVENTIGAEVLKRVGDLGLLHTHQGGADGTVLTDATPPVTQAFGDVAVTGVVAALARRDHKHGMPANPTPAFATPGIVLGAAAAAGAAGTVIRSDSTIAAFDATTPAALVYGGAGAVGAAALAARRDHVHPLANPALGNLPSAPYASLRHSADQTVGNAAFQTLTFTTVESDNNGMYNASFPTRLTCQTAGVYLIVASVIWQPNATGQRALYVYWNGASQLGGQQETNNGGLYQGQAVAVTWALNVGAYVEAQVYQSSGGGLNVLYSAYASPCLRMLRLSGL